MIEEFKENDIPSPGLFKVIYVFRFHRLLHYFPIATRVKKLLFVLHKSAPALINIGTLLFIIIFIYAVIAMNQFSNLKLQGSLTKVTNFRTFGSSFCLLFRIATAAGWNGVLEAAMVQPSTCNIELEKVSGIAKGDCGNKLVAISFFVSYIVLIVLIIVNMYIAVILENFNQAQWQVDAGITEDDIEAYYKSWADFDPKATQFISYNKLLDFLDSLEKPFKIPKPNYWFLEQSDIPIRDQLRCHCLDILEALIHFLLGQSTCKKSEGITAVIRNVHSDYKNKFPLWAGKNTIESTRQRLQKENAAAIKIQRVFRKYLLKQELTIINSIKFPNRKDIDIFCRTKRLVVEMWKATEINEEMIEQNIIYEDNLDDVYEEETDDEEDDHDENEDDQLLDNFHLL